MCLLSQLAKLQAKAQAKPQSQGVTHNSKKKNGIIYLLPRAEHLLWVNTPTTMQKSKYDKKSQVSFQLLSGVGISIDTFHLCQTQPSFVAMYCSCEWGATCCCSSKLMRKPAICAKSTSSLGSLFWIFYKTVVLLVFYPQTKLCCACHARTYRQPSPSGVVE